jgi:hypothetical protein
MTRPTQTGVAILVLLAALAVDVWFIRRSEPHSVAEFSPFTTKLGKEQLILSSPVSQGGPLLSHEGGRNEVVDIFFDKGIVSPKTAQLLRQESWAQSTEPQAISYTTLDSPQAHGASCRTFVDIELENAKASEIRLFQLGLPGGKEHREIAVSPVGSRLVVDFHTAADNPTELDQPGCHKLLQVGPGQIPLVGIPLQILTEADSSVRLKFMPGSSASIGDGSQGLYEPFQAMNLRAPRVRVSPIDSPQALRMVETTDNRPSITIDDLLIGSDEFQTGLSGVGMVTVNGRLVGPTLSEWVSASYGRAALVAFLNLVVVCGILFFDRRGRRASERTTPGGEKIVPEPPPEGLRVFLCHCSEDKAAVRQLHQQLKADGFRPWLDEQNIPPGQLWDDEIQQGLRDSHAIVVCLSKVFGHKEGFVNRELHYALEIALEKPEGAIFLIPLRLEDCEMPARLRPWQWIDLFSPGGYEKLKSALHERARQLGIELMSCKVASA